MQQVNIISFFFFFLIFSFFFRNSKKEHLEFLSCLNCTEKAIFSKKEYNSNSTIEYESSSVCHLCGFCSKCEPKGCPFYFIDGDDSFGTLLSKPKRNTGVNKKHFFFLCKILP